MARHPDTAIDAAGGGRRGFTAPWSRPGGWRTLLVPGWVLLLTGLLLGPALGPGFVLSYDMVFVPRQELLPASIGVGGGLPRAVPQDAVVALLSTVVDGAWLQHVVLLAIPILAGLGGACLVRSAGRGAQLVAATLAIWNPFVVERLVQGHWALLLAYAATPWAIAAAMRVRRTGRGAGAVIGWCALGALVPSGGILVAVVAVPMALVGGAASATRKIVLAGAVVAVNMPWILPAVLHPDSGAADTAGASVFALRSEGPWGPVVTALGGGGLWNAGAVPASRETPIAVVLTALVLVAALAGWSRMRGILDSTVRWWWTVIAAVGGVMAVASSLTPAVWSSAITVIPGAGLARDAHKLLAPLVLLLAVAAALGLSRCWQRVTDPTVRGSVIVAGMLIPLALLPDAAWGASGRLSAVEYPSQWQQMREYIAQRDEPGDVVVLPWSTFREFDFNDGRTVLDPAPRWLTRSSIAADFLPVAVDGETVIIPGDDPRAAVVDRALEAGRPMVEVMPGIGARWVVVEAGQRPVPEPGVLAGLDQVWQEADLAVWELPEAIPITAPRASAGSGLVIAVDLIVLMGVIALGVRALLRVLGGRALMGSGRFRGVPDGEAHRSR